jgi:hypothetical protein
LPIVVEDARFDNERKNISQEVRSRVEFVSIGRLSGRKNILQESGSSYSNVLQGKNRDVSEPS